MNKTFLFHAAWLAIAVAAFLFGRSGGPPSSVDPHLANLGRKSAPTSERFAGAAQSTGGGAGRELATHSRPKSGITVSQFLQESDPLVANKLFAELLLDLDPENARELFDALRDSSQGGRDGPMRLFLEAWGKLDGAAAMGALDDLGGDGRRRGIAAYSVMSGWASADPEAAKAHLATVEEGWQKSVLVHGIVQGLAKADPAAATEYVLELDANQRAAAAGKSGEAEPERGRSYGFDRQTSIIANAQLARGMREATTWVESLPEGAVKSSAFDRVAEAFAQKDPAAAADWIKSHAQHDYAERAVGEVAEELGRDDPASAMQWLTELPEANQTRAIHQSMERWTKQDPVAAGEYLGSMPASTIRDAAVRSFATELDRSDPQVAAQWATTIRNEEVRLDTLHSVARSWMWTNSEEAKSWLPDSGLPAETQENLLRDAERRQGQGQDRRE